MILYVVIVCQSYHFQSEYVTDFDLTKSFCFDMTVKNTGHAYTLRYVCKISQMQITYYVLTILGV